MKPDRTLELGTPQLPLSINPIDPDRPAFGGEVHGLDVAQGVSAEEAAQIEAGMDHYAVLVVPGQIIDDTQQLAFSQHFGPMEKATGSMSG